jgi:hypothetical protein
VRSYDYDQWTPGLIVIAVIYYTMLIGLITGALLVIVFLIGGATFVTSLYGLESSMRP